ncbi:ATP-binding protein [Streptomyces endophyticus]|uniref:ATP-binding protein n=1 Tax=Streptomyces endophyticus TaxID=714166 RepID=A0ABU6FIL4_9ACTN|nr:ATP-binding protein [Streptomyces endophyticus]MEB8342691.1 ATP-binding protein [Streptomyces endophyticus]
MTDNSAISDGSCIRLLPWRGERGQDCYLVTDDPPDAVGVVTRHADNIEFLQLGLARRLLARAEPPLPKATAEHPVLMRELTAALRDTLLVARCRGERLEHLTEWAAGSPAMCRAVRDLYNAAPAMFRLAAFPGDCPRSACAARRFVRDGARAWGLPDEAADAMEAVTGELAANAIGHGQGPLLTVAVGCRRDIVTVVVADEGGGTSEDLPWRPVDTVASAEEESGRGLLIVQGLSKRWGCRPTTGGLSVWAEIALP